MISLNGLPCIYILMMETGNWAKEWTSLTRKLNAQDTTSLKVLFFQY